MPAFIKTADDEDKWRKAKKISGKKFSKGTRKFWKYTTGIWKKTKGIHEDKEEIETADHEKDYMTRFKTWYDEIPNKSSCEKMLTPVDKNKFDTTLQYQKLPGTNKHLYKKKDQTTVWGAPNSFSYIRG